MNLGDFYEDRMAHFDHERIYFQDYVRLITPNKRELHMLDWESRKQEDLKILMTVEIEKIDEEHKILTSHLQELRDEVARLDKLHECRQSQIQRLSELSQPIQKDTTYIIKDRHPFSPSTIASSNISSVQIAPPTYIKQIRSGDIIQLERILEDATTKAANFNHSFVSDILEATSFSTLTLNNSNETLQSDRIRSEEVINGIDMLDHQCYLAVVELLRLRLRIMVAQREETEELEKLRADRAHFSAKEQLTQDSLVQDMKHMKLRIRSELNQSKKDYGEQLLALNRQIGVTKKVLEAARQDDLKVTGDIETLKSSVSVAKDRYERLYRRNLLEMEGFNNEAALLRRRLNQVQKLFTQQEQQQQQLQQQRQQQQAQTPRPSELADHLRGTRPSPVKGTLTSAQKVKKSEFQAKKLIRVINNYVGNDL